MIIKSEKIKCKGKEERKGTSKATGNEYINKVVYFEDKDSTIIEMSFCNDLVYNKATKDKEYQLKFYLSPNGRINLNDIGE